MRCDCHKRVLFARLKNFSRHLSHLPGAKVHFGSVLQLHSPASMFLPSWRLSGALLLWDVTNQRWCWWWAKWRVSGISSWCPSFVGEGGFALWVLAREGRYGEGGGGMIYRIPDSDLVLFLMAVSWGDRVYEEVSVGIGVAPDDQTRGWLALAKDDKACLLFYFATNVYMKNLLIVLGFLDKEHSSYLCCFETRNMNTIQADLYVEVFAGAQACCSVIGEGNSWEGICRVETNVKEGTR